MEYPSNKEEFKSLLAQVGAADEQAWVQDRKDFNDRDVQQFLFLSAIWRQFENPNDSSYKTESIERAQEKVAKRPNRELDVDLKIASKMLAAGITAEEISTLVIHAQFDLAFRILYQIDDTGAGQPQELRNQLKVGMYTEDANEQPIPGTRWGLDYEMLRHARLSNYPSV